MTKFSTMDKPERSFWHAHWTFKKILSCKECTICLSDYREYSPDIHHSTFPCTQWIRYIHRYRTGRSHNHYTAPETKTEIAWFTHWLGCNLKEWWNDSTSKPVRGKIGSSPLEKAYKHLQALNLNIAGRQFLRPVMSARTQTSSRPLAGLRYSRRHTLPRAKKRSCWSTKNEGLFAGYHGEYRLESGAHY